ncbi:hypothetical protein [Qipengyuania atrilutea]|uniref:Uncharacterized protein n=1 Tax=Qipengyuania atrilutea TaxID=2744473 RepID=A0A850H2B1_9SPHN|nr:hypothetical protein [Actirhodobacter atriluteus]NVD44048.1 hypothetical protein [Actirhodobacter atriluteus]
MLGPLNRIALGASLAFCAGSAALAKDDLGLFSGWAAFRDSEVPRCYAIAKPKPTKLEHDYDPYVTVGTWPRSKVRNQVHFRMAREMSPKTTISLRVGKRSFLLTGGGGDAWARDRTMDAAIVAAMRSAETMVVRARDASGKPFSNTYLLRGAATAIDAATVACAQIKRRGIF